MVLGVGSAWAWDPTAGLLALPDLAEERALLTMSSLSPDGRFLSYATRPERWSSQPASTHRYDLASGEVTSTPYLGADRLLVGPDGAELEIDFVHQVDTVWQNSRYSLRRKGVEQKLPMDDRRGFNLSGPAAHWSSNGRALLLGHSYPDSRGYGLSVTDLTTLTVSRRSGHILTGSAPWSPDGRRVLVESRSRPPYVLHFDSGATAPIATTTASPPNWSGVVGWIDDSLVLVYLARNRRLVLSARNVDTAEQFDLVDVPLPTSQLDFSGVVMASHVVQNDPGSITLVEDARRT